MLRYIAIFSIFFMVGCGGCQEDKPLSKIEIKEESKQLVISFERMDRDLFAADFSQPDLACQQLYQKYGNFFCHLVENDLLLAGCRSDSLPILMKNFVTFHDITETNKEIQAVFTDDKIEPFNRELTGAMQRWNHFFPDAVVPKVIYYQSAWNSSIAVTDSVLGISLDCFLGSHHPVTENLAPEFFPRYKKDGMDPQFLVADAVKGWVSAKLARWYEGKDLLAELVFYGKLMYISEALIPECPDSTLMNWTSEQTEWADKHEWDVWTQLANEKVLYQTRPYEINKWFLDGPFTGANKIPQNSPPQLGVWMGWRIVRDYMLAHPELSPAALLAEKNNQLILSSFRPKRN